MIRIQIQLQSQESEGLGFRGLGFRIQEAATVAGIRNQSAFEQRFCPRYRLSMLRKRVGTLFGGPYNKHPTI